MVSERIIPPPSPMNRLSPRIVRCPRLTSVALFLSALAFAQGAEPLVDNAVPPPSVGDRVMSLDDCLAAALQNNHARPASLFAVAIAEAQHRQALSGYWPQLKIQGGFQRDDQAQNNINPAMYLPIPAQTITTPASIALISIPAGVLGPTPVQLPVSIPAQTSTTAASTFVVPEQNIKLRDRDSVSASANLEWLLYDGGMRAGYKQQAQGAINAMKQAARRTDLEITDSVRRMYYGAILGRQLRQLGADTLTRMEATLNLTETMYQGGGGKVTKADYLDNKIMVESIRGLVAQLDKNEAMARAALANTMGLPWQTSITPKDTEIPYAPLAADLTALVSDAYEFSPDWKRLEAGLHALEGSVKTARSGHSPKLAFTGKLHKWWNSYDAGLATKDNKEGWSVGLGVEIPVFDGFLTRNKVAEAKARLNQLKEQRFLLREGLGLQIKDIVLSIEATRKATDATLAAMSAATENRDLNTRAYQNELVDTEKVIRAQITEALTTAQFYKNRYDYITLQSQLTYVVGTEFARQLGGTR